MCKDAFETQRQDFLFYCLFGITKKDTDSDIRIALKACADRAYRDMNRTLDYRYSTSELENKPKGFQIEFDSIKKNYKNAVINTIVNSILDNEKKIIVPNIPNEYNEWHRKLCDDIIQLSKDYPYFEDHLLKKDKFGYSFYYGQAQKWVNMTLKYMIIMGLLNFDEYKECLHVPIDRYIFREILDGKETYKGKAWSRIDYDDYIEIQKIIDSKKSSQSAIEWESEVWLKQAKEENNK